MSIALYGVAADAQLSAGSALAQDSYSSVGSIAFHPSGGFLYVCGVPSSGTPPGSVSSTAAHLATYRIGPDGSLSSFASLPVAGCGPMVVTAPAS